VNARATIEGRPLPGTTRWASGIGLSLALPTGPAPGAERQLATLARHARSRGVTVFEIGEGSVGARVERTLAAAFPAPDPELLLIGRRTGPTGESPPVPRGGGTGASPSESLRRSIEESGRRLAPHRLGLVIWEPTGEGTGSPAAIAGELEDLRRSGDILGAVRCVAPAADGEVVLDPPDGPALFAGALSPLDHRLVGPLAGRSARAPTGFFALDPMAAGRLDGRRLIAAASERRPEAGPVSVRDLHREFDPVLRLGFLTQGGRRTLAQAAIGFALHWPWVTSVLVPLPSPERLEEVLSAGSVPPITDADADRILGAAPDGDPRRDPGSNSPARSKPG